jgi:hypothetical protein
MSETQKPLSLRRVKISLQDQEESSVQRVILALCNKALGWDISFEEAEVGQLERPGRCERAPSALLHPRGTLAARHALPAPPLRPVVLTRASQPDPNLIAPRTPRQTNPAAV